MVDAQQYPAYGGEGPLCLRLGLALGAIATILMILRAYVRLRINDLGGWALFWTALAWAATVTTQSISVFSILHGLGNHVEIVEKTGELTDFLFFTWLTFFFFNLAVPLGKVAVCAFLIEVESKTQLCLMQGPVIRWLLIGIAAFNIIVAIPQLLLTWFQCSPVDSLWNPERQDDCNHEVNVSLTYFVGSVAALTDLSLAIIPSFILWPLQINRKLKIGLCFLMATGVLAAAAAIVRTWAVHYILVEDFTFELWKLFLWGEIEEWIVIICACIPPTWPLFRPVFQRFVTQASSRSRSSLAKKTSSSSAPSTETDGLGMSKRRSRRDSEAMGRAGMGSRLTDETAGTWMELDDDVEMLRPGLAITTNDGDGLTATSHTSYIIPKTTF